MRAAPALLAALLLAPCARGDGPSSVRALEPPPSGAVLRLEDVDGDGVLDVLALSGRRLWVWGGAKGALPAAAPRFGLDVPPEVSALDVARTGRPALLGLAEAGVLRLPLGAGTTAPQPVAGARGLGWRDAGRAVFVDLHPTPGAAAFLVPADGAWALLESDGAVPRPLDLSSRRAVTAAGTFLEESAQIGVGLPRVVGHRAHGGDVGAAPALWALAGDGLVRLAQGRREVFDLAFLPAKGERSLADLDGDGVPELLHRDGENRETRYAFFRLPRALDGSVSPAPADMRPPFSFLRLSGFNLDPAYVDLDGDGRLDLVVTTIEIDAPNTLRAVTSGKVTAVTRAYLLRTGVPDGRPSYPTQPDATVTSDIGVRIRFGYTGNLDVTRSFTILARGDLDGDGRKDLLIRAGTDALLWRRGRAAGVWELEPTRLAFPPLLPGEELEAHAADLDGDGRDELLLHVRAAPGGGDRLLLLDLP